MSELSQGEDWWQASDGKWYPPQNRSQMAPAVAPPTGGWAMSTQQSGYNGVVGTRYRAGWIGLFTGENQSRAVQRTLSDINVQGLKCVGLVRDQWNLFVRLWWALVAIITLGFYVRVPNVLIVTEPMTGVVGSSPAHMTASAETAATWTGPAGRPK